MTVSSISQDSHEYRCVFRYTPHSRGINGLVFPSSPSSPLLYTCSYDGTLRCANLEKGIFDEVRASASSNSGRMEIPVYAAVLTNMYVASCILPNLTHIRSRSIHTITAEVNVEEGEGPGDRCSYSLTFFVLCRFTLFLRTMTSASSHVTSPGNLIG